MPALACLEGDGNDDSRDRVESTGVAMVVRGHSYLVAMHELHDRVPMTNEDVARWRKSKEWQLRSNRELHPLTMSPCRTVT